MRTTKRPFVAAIHPSRGQSQAWQGEGLGRHTMEHTQDGQGRSRSCVQAQRWTSSKRRERGPGHGLLARDPSPFPGRIRTVPADGDPPSPPKPGPGGSTAGWRDPHGCGGSDHPRKGHPKPCPTPGELWAWEEQHPGPKLRGSGGRWWEFWAGFPGTSSLLCSPNRRTQVKYKQTAKNESGVKVNNSIVAGCSVCEMFVSVKKRQVLPV